MAYSKLDELSPFSQTAIAGVKNRIASLTECRYQHID